MTQATLRKPQGRVHHAKSPTGQPVCGEQGNDWQLELFAQVSCRLCLAALAKVQTQPTQN
jgi:hypothetical protein